MKVLPVVLPVSAHPLSRLVTSWQPQQVAEEHVEGLFFIYKLHSSTSYHIFKSDPSGGMKEIITIIERIIYFDQLLNICFSTIFKR